MNLFQKFRQIKKSFSSPYQPLIEVVIFKDSLLHNLNYFRHKSPKLNMAPVLKSNAYGHGLIELGKILDQSNCAFVVVDSLYEALLLRKAGIKSAILIIGFTLMENINNVKLKNVAFAITSLEQLQEITLRLKKHTSFHLKIDTGMHRQGILPQEMDEAIKLINGNKHISLQGVCSHLADADGQSVELTIKQIEIWNSLVKVFKQKVPNISYFHLSATAGFKFIEQAEANVARLGIGLYGFGFSVEDTLNLKPALELRSIVSGIKKIGPGEKVGYNFTFTAQKPTVIATVPVGYYEGVDRRLSNLGSYKLGDNFCPIIGRVSMNISTIDVSRENNVKIGQSVTVFSSRRKDPNSIENIAKLCQTIPYEILVHIPSFLRRIVV